MRKSLYICSAERDKQNLSKHTTNAIRKALSRFPNLLGLVQQTMGQRSFYLNT